MKNKKTMLAKAILFDMDGVLVDNTAVHHRAFELFCRRYGVEDWEAKFSTVYGMGNDDIMRVLLPEEVVERCGTRALGEEKEAIYREIYAPTIAPVKGLKRFLEWLRERDIRCAVGSSGCRQNVEFVLERCAIREFFEVCVAGDEVTRCKPDPEIYLTAAARLGVRPEECIVIEDAKAGIEAARRAGVAHIIALTTTLSAEELATTEARYVVDDFDAITAEMVEI